MDVIRSGKVTFEHLIPKCTNGRAYNKLTQHIEYQKEIYLYEKWYNNKYIEEYLDDSQGKSVYQKIYSTK
jgi:hypothetical protein